MTTTPDSPSFPESGNEVGYRRSKVTSVSIFKNAKSPIIKNGSFTVNHTTNVQASAESGFDLLRLLYDQVAPNAILNAGGRADEVKCYPGTREEVIGLVERWMDRQVTASPAMLWLSGPAGAGKSAIVQTIAERCKQRGVQAANFFFFRADHTRSSARPLVATLLYQISKLYPSARQTIATVLADDPLVFGSSIQDQFDQLLCAAVLGISQPLESPARRPIVLLVDGLDECESENKSAQKQILQALDRLVMQINSPFLVLVASRVEPQISMAIKELRSPIKSIFLDDQYKPANDIRVFVTREFNKIKKSHHFAHTLNKHWPSNEDIESILQKSSGQFVFAATVLRYVANSSASPKISLERVQGISPLSTNLPFANLEAIYMYLLSQVEDPEAVMDLLSLKLLDDSIRGRSYYKLPINDILCAYKARYSPEILESCAADLTAVLRFQEDELVFIHASLPDFLKDKSRAGQYHIDIHSFAAKILPAIWMNAPESWALTTMALTLFVFTLQTPTPDMTNAFLTILPPSLAVTHGVYDCESIIRSIHKLYYSHDIILYKQILRRSISWYVSRPQHCANLYNLETRSLPYVEVYYLTYKIEYWVTCALRAVFYGKGLVVGIVLFAIALAYYKRL